MTLGGQGVHGYSHTVETKKKISDSSKKTWEKIKSDPEKYKKVCDSRKGKLLGRVYSAETIKRMSESASKKVGELNSFYGKHHSKETKDKIAKCNSKEVIMLKGDDIVKVFESMTKAAEYIINNKDEFLNIKSNKIDTVVARISYVVHQGYGEAYGYSWKFS